MTSRTVCVSSGQFLAGRRRTCKSTVCRGRGGIWWKETKRELKPWQIRLLSKMLLVQAFVLISRTIESRASRKTGAQGAAGGSSSEASFHDLTSTRSLRRDLGSCCWNKGSGERRRAIMQLCVLGIPPLCTSGPPTSPRSHSFQLRRSSSRTKAPPLFILVVHISQGQALRVGVLLVVMMNHSTASLTTSLTPAPSRLRSESRCDAVGSRQSSPGCCRMGTGEEEKE